MVLQFPHDHYMLIRDFFFPSEQSTELESKSFLHSQHVRNRANLLIPQHVTQVSQINMLKQSNTNNNIAVVASAPAKKPEKYCYFKYFRVNNIQFTISYRGGMMDINNLIFDTGSFFTNKHVGSWNSIFGEMEKVFQSKLMWQCSQLIVSKKEETEDLTSAESLSKRFKKFFGSLSNASGKTSSNKDKITNKNDPSTGSSNTLFMQGHSRKVTSDTDLAKSTLLFGTKSNANATFVPLSSGAVNEGSEGEDDEEDEEEDDEDEFGNRMH
jgi:hypothetical protein